jgi:MoaA/NifB/PqqE/SkfB family radical SAM enzyme/SAM-dependent methyltransferase
MDASAAAVALPMVRNLPALDGSANIFRDRYSWLSDEEWRDLLIRSIREPEIDGIPFPGFPAPEVQEHMHGHSGEVSLHEAQGFYSFIKSRPAVTKLMQPGATFLDFGSGWGRVARLFLRDFDLGNIYGFEPNRGYCTMARSLNPYICFLNGDFTPDRTLPPDRFDLVVGWSIFSHLSERSAGDWLEEMARVTRPDGCCVFTTWGKRFLDTLVSQQDKLLHGDDADVHWYYKECLRGAGDIRRQREKFENGEFVWFTTFQSELYGDAFINPDTLQSLLRARRLPFEVVDFDQQSLGQDAFILRRGELPGRTVSMGAAEPPDVMRDPKAGLPLPATSDSFCIHYWDHFRIEGNGEASVCCAYEGGAVAQDGVPMSLERHSLTEIWNSDAMCELRRETSEGRRVPGCRQCYADEARGGVSQRVRDNTAWEGGWMNPDRLTERDIAAPAAKNDYRLATLPKLIEIETGNLCNLKCRMCDGKTSSLIAKDLVHHKWSEGHRDRDVAPSAYSLQRPVSVTSLATELAKDTGGQVKRLYFIGGEPLLVREVRGLLEGLIAAGHAHEIALSFVTNGLVVPRWLSLTAQFHRVDFAVSVDGIGDHYEYIRYPGRWSELTQRLQQIKELPNTNLIVTSTIQMNNALNITDLFRHLDSIEIPFTAYLLHWPQHLAATALPTSVRRLAASRLREYGERDCRPQQRALVLSLASQFEAGDDAVDPDRLRDFMLFTNDLDASRGQSIHRTDPELVERLAQAGFPWQDELLHAVSMD